MKTKRIKVSSLLTVIGIALIAVACLSVVFSAISQNIGSKRAAEIASDLKALMPEPQNSFPDGRSNTAMPTAELDGVDFAGIIEIPAYGTSLPICSEWKSSRLSSYPCRLAGSMHSLDLIIGGSDGEGMFDFMKLITNGDYVFVTDMSGACFTYRVIDIVQTDTPTPDNLRTDESDLVLFAKNTYSFGYTVVRCTIDK